MEAHKRRLELLCDIGDIERAMEGAGGPPRCPTQHAVLLSFVREKTEVRNKDVAMAFAVTPASATGMLHRAVAAGLLRRKKQRDGARYMLDPNGNSQVSPTEDDGWPPIAC